MDPPDAAWPDVAPCVAPLRDFPWNPRAGTGQPKTRASRPRPSPTAAQRTREAARERALGISLPSRRNSAWKGGIRKRSRPRVPVLRSSNEEELLGVGVLEP